MGRLATNWQKMVLRTNWCLFIHHAGNYKSAPSFKNTTRTEILLTTDIKDTVRVSIVACCAFNQLL